MTVTAQVPCGVTSEVDSGAVCTRRAGVVTGAAWDPQPAARGTSPAHSSARTAPGRNRRLTSRPR